VNLLYRTKKLEGVRTDAAYERRIKGGKAMPATLGADFVCALVGLLKIAAAHDQLHTECLHRRVFFDAVALGDYDRCANAVFPGGETNRLAVITG